MQEEKDIEINPKLLKIINETLDLVKKERRRDFIGYLFSSFDQVAKKARDDAERYQEDYKIVLKREIEKKELDLSSFCIDGC